jgi:hypothetical protein
MALSLGIKQPKREADHSSSSSSEVKNARNYASTPSYFFIAYCLIKHRNNFTFYLYNGPTALSLYIQPYTEAF